MENIHSLTKQFDCSHDEARVLENLLTGGVQTVFSLYKNTQIKRTTLYGLLSKLIEKGLVLQTRKNGARHYTLVPTEKLETLLDQRISEIQKIKSNISSFEAYKQSSLPQVQVFEGVGGVKHILYDLILRSGLATEAFWPIRDMLTLLGNDYFEFLNRERIQRNIFVRAIWPSEQVVDVKKHPYLGSGEKFLRDIRVAPKQIDFSMGYWIYGDSVAFLSSKKEAFGFIIKSAELSDMLRKQFDLIWKLSLPLKQKNSPEIDTFLGSIPKNIKQDL